MFQDNPLLAQLKQQIKENIPKKEGVIKATERGFGFLEVDNKTSIFIPPPQMKKCLHGDKVIALIRNENDKEFAEPDELIEQSLNRFIGRVKFFKGKLNVIPDKMPFRKLSFKAKARKGLNPETLAEGDWVVAHLIRHPLKGDDGFFVEINEKITNANDKIAPWLVTLAENNLPSDEPKGIENLQIVDDINLNRVDMTEVPFITIDGESTKDMDDALYAEKLDSGDYEVTIAIADPTAYVLPESETDSIARQRGFTIYLPGRNIPMLPRELADELCSLHENKIRPTLCCRVTVSPNGIIHDDIQFFAANIKSHAQLSYNDVSDWLENPNDCQFQPDETIATVLKTLCDFSRARSNWRESNAVVFKDRPDYRFELSEDNDVIAIHSEERRTANRLVEEAMIMANICAGIILKQQVGIGIFNTHAGFKPEKIKDVIKLVNIDPENVFDKEKLTSLDGFSQLRRWLNTQESSYLDSRLRKFQTYSDISHIPSEHFAMGLPIYATWTSPIRKYSDMVNHRLLKDYILNREPHHKPDDKLGGELIQHRKHHKIAERNVANWLYARTLKNEPEKETKYTAEIFDINRAGMRVRLLENGASAFIPAILIIANKERIECNSESGTISIDSDHVYKLGDMLEIELTEVSVENRNIIAKPTQVLSDPK